jgi:hypothetical protein
MGEGHIYYSDTVYGVGNQIASEIPLMKSEDGGQTCWPRSGSLVYFVHFVCFVYFVEGEELFGLFRRAALRRYRFLPVLVKTRLGALQKISIGSQLY